MRTAHDVRAERRSTWRDAYAITRKARGEKRELTDTEQRKLDRLLATIADLDAEQDDIEAEALRAAVRPVTVESTTNTTRQGGDLDRFLRSGNGIRRIGYTPREKRTLVVGTASAGGALAPRDFASELWRVLEDSAPMMAAGRIFATDGGRTLDIPRVTSFGSAVAVSEGSAIAGTDPAFDVLTLGAHKVAQLTQASRELLSDAGVDVQSFLAEAMGRNIDQTIGPWLTLGTGGTEPIGYLTNAGTAIVGGTAVGGRPSYPDLVAVYGDLAPQYRRNAAWLVSDSALVAMRGLTDTTGQPLWAPAIGGEPETFMGKPVLVDPYLPAVGTAARSIVFGDPSAYAVRIADGGIDVEVSQDFAFDQDLTTFRGVLRIDAAPLANNAFTSFRGGTA